MDDPGATVIVHAMDAARPGPTMINVEADKPLPWPLHRWIAPLLHANDLAKAVEQLREAEACCGSSQHRRCRKPGFTTNVRVSASKRRSLHVSVGFEFTASRLHTEQAALLPDWLMPACIGRQEVRYVCGSISTDTIMHPRPPGALLVQKDRNTNR